MRLIRAVLIEESMCFEKGIQPTNLCFTIEEILIVDSYKKLPWNLLGIY